MKKQEQIFITGQIGAANDSIVIARNLLTSQLERMLGKKTHTFKKYDIYVTDEEYCTREQIKSCNKDLVTFLDGSTMNIGDIGTDDLYAIVSFTYDELTEK